MAQTDAKLFGDGRSTDQEFQDGKFAAAGNFQGITYSIVYFHVKNHSFSFYFIKISMKEGVLFYPAPAPAWRRPSPT